MFICPELYVALGKIEINIAKKKTKNKKTTVWVCVIFTQTYSFMSILTAIVACSTNESSNTSEWSQMAKITKPAFRQKAVKIYNIHSGPLH